MRRTCCQPDNVFEQRLQPFPRCSSISCFLLAETTWFTKSIHSSELKCFIISPVSLSSAVRSPAVGAAGPRISHKGTFGPEKYRRAETSWRLVFQRFCRQVRRGPRNMDEDSLTVRPAWRLGGNAPYPRSVCNSCRTPA